jgi:hypothetical protein
VALLSDIDWLIVLGVGAFLLFGRAGGSTVRQLGRWYGKALRLKQELVSEVARAADLPLPAGASAGSLRAALLGLDSTELPRSGIPAVVRTPPLAGPSPGVPPTLPSTGGFPVASWSATYFVRDPGSGELR